MGLTNIENDALKAQINQSKAIVSHLNNIDWEQRRYEIAKDYLCNNKVVLMDVAVEKAVKIADLLIKELRSKN